MRRGQKRDIEVYKIDGEYVGTFRSARKAAEFCNITSTAIYLVLHGKLKHAQGYTFKEVNNGKETCGHV